MSGACPKLQSQGGVKKGPAFERAPESESESCSVVSDSLRPHGLYSPWNSPGQNTGVGSLSLLQWIFLTQESNQDPSSRLKFSDLNGEDVPRGPHHVELQVPGPEGQIAVEGRTESLVLAPHGGRGIQLCSHSAEARPPCPG